MEFCYLSRCSAMATKPVSSLGHGYVTTVALTDKGFATVTEFRILKRAVS